MFIIRIHHIYRFISCYLILLEVIIYFIPAAKVVINILNQIKEQNKIILARFEAIEQRLDESVNKSGNLTIPKFPSKLPLTSIEELNTLEEYLQSQDKLQSFVSLGSFSLVYLFT